MYAAKDVITLWELYHGKDEVRWLIPDIEDDVDTNGRTISQLAYDKLLNADVVLQHLGKLHIVCVSQRSI